MNKSFHKILAALAIASLVACGSTDSDDPEPESSSSVAGSSAVSSSSGTSSSAISSAGSSSSVSSSSTVSSSSEALACLPATVVGPITGEVRMCESVVYDLSDFVQVVDGATLHIDAGTRIASQGVDALIIMPGGKIMARGTAEKPIVFTSKAASPQPGDWAGLVIMGKAPVSTADNTQGFEANTEWRFGGSDTTDNSGVLEYVRVEWAGYQVALDKELNGITLGGVGRETTLNYLHVHEGSDDLFEFFGGFVDMYYSIGTGGEDDGWDIDEGFQGTIQYGILLQGANSDRGIESGSKASNQNQITSVDFKNVTIIANRTNQAVQIKDNVAIRMEKGLILTLPGDTAKALLEVQGARARDEVIDDNTFFDDVFYGGHYQNIVDLQDTTNPTQAAQLTSLLEAQLTSLGANVVPSTVLNADLTLKAGAAKTAGAGHEHGTNIWWTGWTLAGSLTLP